MNQSCIAEFLPVRVVATAGAEMGIAMNHEADCVALAANKSILPQWRCRRVMQSLPNETLVESAYYI